MSWISDVKYEISKLNLSNETLRKFGITVGIVFLLLGIWFILSDMFFSASLFFIVLGGLLILFGLFFPKYLKSVYLYWMTAAFVLGWFISRFLLSILFFFVITPIAIVAKLIKKEFLNVKFQQKNTSYWTKKDTAKINYDKMY